jgi:hypothetical protein
MFKLALATLALLFPIVVFAQIYQWKDAEGKIQYSDQPPPASVRQERTVAPRAAAPSSAPAAAKPSYQDQEAAFRQRQVEQDESKAARAKENAEAQERKRNCEMAQGNLRNLQVGGRQVRFDGKSGERVYLSDDEISQSIKDAQRSVDEWCKPRTAQR